MASLPPIPPAIAGLFDCEVTDSRWSGPRSIRQLAYALRRGTIHGAEDVAIATAKLLEPIAANAQYESLDDLIVSIRGVGSYLQRIQPFEQSVGNVIRRALHQLREDAIEEGIISQRSLEESSVTLASGTSSSTPAAMSASPSHTHPEHQRTGARPRPSLEHFRPGSNFSITDLVAAGAGASTGSSNNSRVTTPGQSQSHTRQGSASAGALASSIGHMSLSSVTEKDVADKAAAHDSDGESEEIEGSISQLSSILVGVAEKIIEDIRMAPQEMASKCAAVHIHSGEIIMTIGHDKAVEQFLKTASKHRQFTVLVAESAPGFSGHTLAKALSAAKVQTILVPDANIVALLPRVSKVILGAKLILADGGLLVEPGVRLVADLARLHHRPAFILAGTYKLCPDPTWISAGTWLQGTSHVRAHVDGSSASLSTTHNSNLSAARGALDGPPEAVLAASSIPGEQNGRSSSSSSLADRVVSNPTTDYLGPSGYDVLITNTGEHAVSLVHLLVAQNYDRQDLVL